MSIASSLPVEIVDEILSHIEEPGDLTPILFVSKSFKALADRHISYRVIRCPLGVIQLWEHLSQNPSLAENVRVLEIQRESDYASFDVPRAFYNAAAISRKQDVWGLQDEVPYHDLERLRLAGLKISETTLISALKNMSRLTSFKWEGKPPLIDSRLDGFPDDIWTTLRGHETLTELDVLDLSGEALDQTSDPQPHLRNIHDSLVIAAVHNLCIVEYLT